MKEMLNTEHKKILYITKQTAIYNLKKKQHLNKIRYSRKYKKNRNKGLL